MTANLAAVLDEGKEEAKTSISQDTFSKKLITRALAGVTQLVRASSHKLKSCGFDFSRGTCLACRFGPWLGRGAYGYGRQPIDVSL